MPNTLSTQVRPLDSANNNKINMNQIKLKKEKRIKIERKIIKKVDVKSSWQKVIMSFEKLVNKKNELNMSYFQYIKEYSCCSRSRIYDDIYKSVKDKLDIKNFMTSVFLENESKKNNSY